MVTLIPRSTLARAGRRHLRLVQIALTCLLALATALTPLRGAAQSNCSVIYNGGNGWIIDMCASDPGVARPMAIVVGGIARGNAAVVRIYHKSQVSPGSPQVAVIYASGFIRLKPNADPSPPIPFGSSFILGPAYWPNASTYYHSPQLRRLEIDTAWLPRAPLRMQASGTNGAFNIVYKLELPFPRDRQTRLHVTQTYTAAANIAIDSTRRAQRQGFKLVQISSMFINESGACGGGHTNCHDSNATRYIGPDLVRRQVAFSTLQRPGFIFNTPPPLGSTWLDALHTDNISWQGNTPNVRIALDALPLDHTLTPQGWIGATADPNDDNVGLWLHDDGAAAQSWSPGQVGQTSYWLLAQDNPPEPWADLGLRSGQTFLNFESSYNCFRVLPANLPVTGSVTPISGYTGRALRLNYNLGNTAGNWAQIRCNFDPPLDLSAYDHLRLDWRGHPVAANSVHIGLVNPGVSQEYIFASEYRHVTHHVWWGQLVIPYKSLLPWTGGTRFDPHRVSAFFVSVLLIKDPADGIEDDVGGAGNIAIDNLNVYNVKSRTVPAAFETVAPSPVAANAAASWLAAQQQSNGLLKSWKEEEVCLSHTYDQALALIVFAHRRMWVRANALVGALSRTQNTDGSWFQSHNCSTMDATTNNKWAGDIAWASYALSRYLALGGTHPQAATIRNRAADWLRRQINQANGCLFGDSTEGNIDAWWSLHSAGLAYAGAANQLKACLLRYYWDEELGRFKGGRNGWQPYLDNQTWGAAFLRAIGEQEKARRALSYARAVLRLPAQGGQLYGFDGQAGPWSVWNEGGGQYAAVGGAGANDLVLELLAQQRSDGAVPGSPDNFRGGGVWTTRWHGVAPTAWLYNALCDEPFPQGLPSRCS